MIKIDVQIPDITDGLLDDLAEDTGLSRSSLERFAIEEFARNHRFLHHDHYKVQFLKRAVAK